MKAIVLSALALAMGTFHPAASAASAAKCVAQYTDNTWPYYSTLNYTPENTTFKFVCPGQVAKTIPELYQAGWKLIGLPWLEQKFGSGKQWSIWIEHA